MATKLTQMHKDIFIISLIIFAGVSFKIIPHLPDFSPEIVLSLYIGHKLPSKWAWMVILLITVISDYILSLTMGYPAFGSWSYFTYSGMIAICLLGSQTFFKGSSLKFLALSLLSALAYWLWTNLGVWLTSNFYPHTENGFLICYVLALPFLKNSLLSSLVWGIFITVYESRSSLKCCFLRQSS